MALEKSTFTASLDEGHAHTEGPQPPVCHQLRVNKKSFLKRPASSTTNSGESSTVAYDVDLACRELIDCLVSPEVQVALEKDSDEIESKLTDAEVANVFVRYLGPDVRYMLFRQLPGKYALEFIQASYRQGFTKLRGTIVENHLKWMLRSIVHYAHEGRPDASSYLRDVAEAFTSCQAVQARVV